MRTHLLTGMLAALLTALAPAAAAASPSIVVKHVRANGISIAYWSLGSGRPLVLIAGFGFTMIEWDPELVGALAKHHRVIIFNNRGVPPSTNTPRDKLTIEQMADDTDGLIRGLHLRRPDVLGWSMGGYIAQDLALEHPGLIRKLVLASTDFGGSKAKRPSLKVVRKLLRVRGFRQAIPLLFPSGAQKLGWAWVGRVLGQAQKLGFSDAWLNPGPVATKQGQASYDWERTGNGSYDQLPRLRTPTLIAAGSKDVIVPPRNARMLHARIRHSKLVVYAGAGHAFLFQDPLAVARRINAFLG